MLKHGVQREFGVGQNLCIGLHNQLITDSLFLQNLYALCGAWNAALSAADFNCLIII